MTIAETQGKRTPMFIADDFELNTLHCTRKNLEKQHTPRFSGKLVSPENKLYVTCKRSRSPDYNYVGHSVGPSCWIKKGWWSDGTTHEREKRRPRQITKNGATSNYTQIARLIFSAHTVKMLVKARRSTLGTPSVKGALALNIPLLVIIAYFHGILAAQLNIEDFFSVMI